MQSPKQDLYEFSTVLANLGTSVEAWSAAHLFIWPVFWQATGLLVLMPIIYLLARPLRPALEQWNEQLRPESALARLAPSILSHIYAIIFLIPLWLAIGILVRLDAADQNDLLVVVASLMSAWVLIKLISSFIANRLLAKLVFFFAWSVAALNILGLLDEVLGTLDAVGIPLGDSRLSLLTVLNGLLLFSVLLWGALALSRLMQDQLSKRSEVSPRARVLLDKSARFILIALAVIVALSSLGVNLAALAVFAGVLGVGLGIGLQHQIANLVSGLFLLLDKSVKPGDVIEVGDTFGWVKDMRARYVGMVTRDNKELLIPNDEFVTNQLINWSHNDRDLRLEIPFGVSYQSDPYLVRRIAVEAALEASPRIVKSRQPVCHLKAFGDSSLDFVLRFWINDPQNGVTNIKGLVFLKLWDKFIEHGVAIPYPHRQILLPNSDTPVPMAPKKSI